MYKPNQATISTNGMKMHILLLLDKMLFPYFLLLRENVMIIYVFDVSLTVPSSIL